MRRLMVVMGFVVCAMTAQATELIVDQRPFYARTLGGVVTDAVGYPLAGATVQVVSCDASPVTAAASRQVVSDVHGMFSFGRFTGGKACLRFSKDGFNSVQIKVYRREDASDLAQKLVPAT